MRDVVFVAVTVGFFGLAAAYIGACARIIGREALVEVDGEGDGEGDPDRATAEAERVGVLS